jgi:hypothetical protein
MNTLDIHRDEFIQGVDDSLALVRTANAIQSTPGLSINLTIVQAERILEWAFVSIHTSWEIFLERCFLTYMQGGQTSSGYKPIRYVFPNDEQHALKLLLSGKDFFPWTSPTKVLDAAELCFQDGAPFRNVLEPSATDLMKITTIRNAIVHRSKISTEKFRTLVRNEMKTAPLNITPGQFLSMIKSQQVKTTYISYYCNKLKLAAHQIIPN